MSSEDVFQIPPPLSQSVGYGILIGVGAAFAVGMSLVSWFLSRYMNEIQDSEMFMTAKHSVKTGLTASAVVSSWTIAATLLTSTTYGYYYGISGPFWYAAGASVQITLFSVAAIELKRRAPKAQTFLQLVMVRYGRPAHIVFFVYCLVYQTLVTVNLLVGGSAIFATMTGVNRDASCFLFPIGVVIYTLMGGIKATFITDWLHTVVIYIIMCWGLIVVYTRSAIIGSPERMYELLMEAAALHPVEGNAEGSYLTMRSESGGYIGLVFIGAGFAAAVDSQLFQKAIAADPRSTANGYHIGALSWFTIPFVLASTFGLTAAAVEHLDIFPTYPNRMSDYEVSSGMPLAYAAFAIMGTGGSVAVCILVFMAVTSAMSSETVATTALLSYNLYKIYIKPEATGRQILVFSHWVTPGFALVSAGIAAGLNHAGFNVSLLTTASGIFVDSCIVPMACTIMWKKQSKLAVVGAPIIGSIAGLVAWFATAYTHFGEVTITTINQNLPLVAGNMMSLCAPIVLTPLLTYIKPENFDWEIFKREIKAGDDEHITVDGQVVERSELAGYEEILAAQQAHDEENERILLKARNRSIYVSLFLTLALCILWPIPMYGSSYVFSKGFFKGWIIVLFFWAFIAAGTITLLPIWEGRNELLQLWRFITGKRGKADTTPVFVGEETSVQSQRGEKGGQNSDGEKM
ncbi:putative sodium/proline symporter [Thozetella sp. PMI_491]|nr:putative sodium/proline symporter [Thozetella sp. PMI_491]